MADNKDKKTLNKGHKPPSLSALLKGNNETNTSNSNRHREGISNNPSVSPESLEQLLAKSNNKAANPSTIHGDNKKKSSDLPELSTLLGSGNQQNHTQVNTRNNSNKTEQSLQQIINSSPQKESKKPRKKDDKVKPTKNNKVVKFAFVAVFIASIISYIMMAPNQPLVPNSDVAKQLMVIVDAIEKYQSENSRLPQKLSTLNEFPKGAVEWKIEQYDLQLESSTLELFLWSDASGYIVISRYADEAWMYSSNDEAKLKRIPAR